MQGHLPGIEGVLGFLSMEDETLNLAWLQLLMPFLMLVVNITAQFTGCRYVASLSLLKSAFFGYGVGLVCLIVCEFVFFKQQYAAPDFWALVITNFAVYSMFGYWYFIFITLAETAIRTRLLIELDLSVGGLSEQEMLAKYNTRELIEKRINRLVGNGQILNVDGRFYCGGKSGLVLFGKFSNMMHKLVPGEKGEA